MPDTYTQIYIHIVFAVQNRKALIQLQWEEELYKYISGIVKNKKQKLLSINGVADHIHLLIGMKPDCCLSDLVREIKKASNVFINENKFTSMTFRWQEGFGAFSYSHSQISTIIHYIENQKEHHKKRKFKEEYLTLLNSYEIEYKNEYLFNWNEKDNL
jgi:REP element-mobilizing transposase RayT